MTLLTGQHLEVVIEKPVAGGRMLARHEGQVLFVHGAIPGERVVVRVERVERQLAFGTLVQVLEPSSDRRAPGGDPLCGGCFYAHVAYPRQLQLKAALIADAFGRLGRLPLPGGLAVAASPELAYRMRARFHVEGTRVGFYREGTHQLCDARDTGHLSEQAVCAAEMAVDVLRRVGSPPSTVILAENIPADGRVLHVEYLREDDRDVAALGDAATAAGLAGCTSAGPDGRLDIVGTPAVSDALATVTGGRVGAGSLQRHARSFFQANRFLLPDLVTTVLDAVPAEGPVVDLYAGVGLFAVSLAAVGHPDVTAVEGDASSADDLASNAAAAPRPVHVVRGSVERFVRAAPRMAHATIIVDPPRTGISRTAMQAVVSLGARRVVYVSCDPATMARDARRLVDGGYGLATVEAFDLFPNTPHVEAVAVFDRHGP